MVNPQLNPVVSSSETSSIGSGSGCADNECISDSSCSGDTPTCHKATCLSASKLLIFVATPKIV